MSDIDAKKYITRTSKAGTLLLCEEDGSLQKTSGKRSRQASRKNSIDDAEFHNGVDLSRGTSYHRHSRHMSDRVKGDYREEKRSRSR